MCFLFATYPAPSTCPDIPNMIDLQRLAQIENLDVDELDSLSEDEDEEYFDDEEEEYDSDSQYYGTDDDSMFVDYDSTQDIESNEEDGSLWDFYRELFAEGVDRAQEVDFSTDCNATEEEVENSLADEDSSIDDNAEDDADNDDSDCAEENSQDSGDASIYSLDNDVSEDDKQESDAKECGGCDWYNGEAQNENVLKDEGDNQYRLNSLNCLLRDQLSDTSPFEGAQCATTEAGSCESCCGTAADQHTNLNQCGAEVSAYPSPQP